MSVKDTMSNDDMSEDSLFNKHWREYLPVPFDEPLLDPSDGLQQREWLKKYLMAQDPDFTAASFEELLHQVEHDTCETAYHLDLERITPSQWVHLINDLAWCNCCSFDASFLDTLLTATDFEWSTLVCIFPFGDYFPWDDSADEGTIALYDRYYAARRQLAMECSNCRQKGHEIRHCIKADADGWISGCTLCNSRPHHTGECAGFAALTEAQRFDLVVTSRRNMPPLKLGHGLTWHRLAYDYLKDHPSAIKTGMPWSEKTVGLFYRTDPPHGGIVEYEQTRNADVLVVDPRTATLEAFCRTYKYPPIGWSENFDMNDLRPLEPEVDSD